MSYLNNVHMVFSGQFQADVSTVNNDIAHYDNANFKPRFQEYGPGATNGWWNPCGSGAFRLINCKVSGVGYEDGSTTSNPCDDPVIGMLIAGSNEETSAKIVDLDPQMQMVSELWGLTMRLTDGKTPGFFEGKYLPAPFRDILFGRAETGAGDVNATAIYQSVLEDLSWVDADSSPFLQQLKKYSEKSGKLSVRFMTYNFDLDHKSETFTLGKVLGVIGPAFEDEPDTFILGRRFAPPNGMVTPQNINFFNAQVSSYSITDKTTGKPEQKFTLCTDFSNALPFKTTDGGMADVGNIQLAVLNQDFPAGTSNLSPSFFTLLGEPIPYQDTDWLENTSGLVFCDISPRLMPTLQQSPLALINLKDNSILIRETVDGILVRADQVVHRLNPPATGSVDLYASQYGQRTSLEVSVYLQQPNQGTSPTSSGKPVMNTPDSAISVKYKNKAQTIQIDSSGKTTYQYEVTDPDNPRGYIDGQLYLLCYKPTQYPGYSQYQFDQVMNHVYDIFPVPNFPVWNDVQEFMTQYGNLYPIMSRMLVDLSSYSSVVRYRSLLELAFSRPLSDPNYMPVTRDLSDGKRETIIKWLTMKDKNGEYILAPGTASVAPADPTDPCPSCEIDLDPSTVGEAVATEHDASQADSKTRAARHYRQNAKEQGE